MDRFPVTVNSQLSNGKVAVCWKGIYVDKDPSNDAPIGKRRKQFAFILTCVWIDKKKL